jgi:hypothetical protein
LLVTVNNITVINWSKLKKSVCDVKNMNKWMGYRPSLRSPFNPY